MVRGKWWVERVNGREKAMGKAMGKGERRGYREISARERVKGAVRCY